MNEHFLGQWAVIDIETTGVNPGQDDIIDVGFLKFDGLELVEEFQSLINYEYELPEFIKQLTGIKEKELKLAPSQKTVFNKLSELEGYSLLAHNADFEKSFLEDVIPEANYVDSLFYLPILFPEIKSLKLENWIVDFNLADQEIHRGFEDSVDLLKTVLLTTYLIKESKFDDLFIQSIWKKYLNNNFWQMFNSLEQEELVYISKQIKFNLEDVANNYLTSKAQKATNFRDDIEDYLGEYQFNGQAIESLLKDQKYMEQFIDGYHVRDQQVQMAQRVGQTFAHNLHALVEAPTGTGKTIGYLLPSILYAKEKGEQVLIATATKTLQKQITEKDLPIVDQIFASYKDYKVVKLIGTNNHFCELSFRNLDDDLFESEDIQWAKLYFENLFNNNKNSENLITTEDVPYVLKMKSESFSTLLESLKVDYRTCIGKNCPHKMDCSYIKGISDAKDADIVITNHALMFSWPQSIPMPRKVIIDEAHKLEGSVTSSYTQEFFTKDLEYFATNIISGRRLGSLKYLIKVLSFKIEEDFDQNLKDFSDAITNHFENLTDKIELYFKSKQRFSDTYWNESLFENKKESISNQTELEILNSIDSLNFVFQTMSKYFERFKVFKEQISFNDNEKLLAWNNCEFLINRIDDTSLFFNNILHDDDDLNYTLSYHHKYGSKLNIEPIDCGKLLKEVLLDKIDSSVSTSATIGIGQKNKAPLGIQWNTGQLYLDPQKRFKSDLSLPPLFDYKNKAKVFICSDTPYFNTPEFIPTVLKDVAKLIKQTNGKSLLLFSSKVRFNLACDFLFKYFDQDYSLFIQGMGANVVDEFKKSSKGVLVGLESFGEGIDIPGKQLQFVFIDKIPDLRQDLVIKKRREFFQRNFGNEFEDYFMASRERTLLQKLGRLLRTLDDYGGAIVVDSRLAKWKQHTKNKFFKNLYPYVVEETKLEDACKKVSEFLTKF